MPDQTSPVGDNFPMSTYTEGDLVIIDGRRWRVARISDDGRPSVRLVRMPTYTRIGTTVYADVLDRIGTRVPPAPELSREHLEVFAVDPHAAAESEVAAMAQELLAARARIAELEAQREPIGYLIVTEVEGRRVVHGDHRQLMTCAEAIESVGRSDLPRGMRHLLCTVQEADR
ncbi:hypothetical protein IU414_06425 [Nocardia farcinica]|uniref:hypothetical protein n=1 Tax=Nocardia farcinica TaxID=37329 RepID=UPI0018959EDF|nr:hypothetical protein [Nocardia farcinica]MBF6584394.1 hypothetical protein [Nocardia farcinica]